MKEYWANLSPEAKMKRLSYYHALPIDVKIKIAEKHYSFADCKEAVRKALDNIQPTSQSILEENLLKTTQRLYKETELEENEVLIGMTLSEIFDLFINHMKNLDSFGQLVELAITIIYCSA